MIIAIVSSATLSVEKPAAFETATPRSLHASRSTWLTPVKGNRQELEIAGATDDLPREGHIGNHDDVRVADLGEGVGGSGRAILVDDDLVTRRSQWRECLFDDGLREAERFEYGNLHAAIVPPTVAEGHTHFTRIAVGCGST
jgi:hypothetical protein